MHYEFTSLNVIALLASGVLAGFINAMAGGGSMLTLPALMVLGMPADIANATNRVGVVLQAVVGVRGFAKSGHLPLSNVPGITAPTVAGALVGSVAASYLPVPTLKPVLLVTMIAMALIILIKPSVVEPPQGTNPFRVSEKPSAAFWLFIAGVYGGFVQAGVGFLLITTLAGVLRYQLVAANALKLVCTLIFGIAALAVFALRGQVLWLPGLVLSLGTMLGAQLGVSFAIRAKQRTLKWVLFAMVLLASAAAFIKN